jgi:hypothetical protein
MARMVTDEVSDLAAFLRNQVQNAKGVFSL